METHEQRMRTQEAEMFAVMGILVEVFKCLAEISPQHEAAVRGGFDEAIRLLSMAVADPSNAAIRDEFGYALKSAEWLSLSALAPRGGGKAHATVQ
jgi:hypothetical protein